MLFLVINVGHVLTQTKSLEAHRSSQDWFAADDAIPIKKKKKKCSQKSAPEIENLIIYTRKLLNRSCCYFREHWSVKSESYRDKLY